MGGVSHGTVGSMVEPGRVASASTRRAGLAVLLAVVGPGLLAGLSDDDPAGITTYSVLGAKSMLGAWA